MPEYILEMRGITKRFPGVVANDNITFKVRKGEIHALVGENGAGKSTLMKILYGVYSPDGGEILIRGKKVHIRGSHDAIRLGIGMVFQHFMLIPVLTVAENVVLGMETHASGVAFDFKKAVREVRELAEKHGLKIDPEAKVSSLTVGEQQRVEILKILYRGAEILILDEPTAVLTPQEVEELYRTLKSLKDQGKTVIFITHKLKEVYAVADWITVLRHGKVVASDPPEKMPPERLVECMVGRRISLRVEKPPKAPGETVLEVDGLSVKNDKGLDAVKNLFLKVRSGEILGIAGVEGNGQTELVEAITGMRKIESGKIRFLGREIKITSPRVVREIGIGHIPEDRQRTGLILDFSVSENLILGRHYRRPFANGVFLNLPYVDSVSWNLIKKYDIKTPSTVVPARNLSGGNQQKVVVAREISGEPKLLVASQPTRGLDIGAMQFVHTELVKHRSKGNAVLLVSADLDEVMELSDKIAVMYEGEIVGVFKQGEVSEKEIGLYMTGAKRQSEEEIRRRFDQL